MQDQLSSYVAKHVRDVLADRVRRSALMEELEMGHPFVENAFMAVAIIDVTGYSSLTSYLAEFLGKVSSELLSEAVGEYLAKIASVVLDHGGDIVKFLGDAILVTFSAAKPTEPHNSICERATLCCSQILLSLGSHPIDVKRWTDAVQTLPTNSALSRPVTSQIRDGQTALGLHIAVTCGEFSHAIVGSLSKRLDYAIVGDALRHLGDLLEAAKEGHMGVSDEMAKFLSISFKSNRNNILNISEIEAFYNIRRPDSKTQPYRLKEPLHKTLNLNLLRLFINQSLLYRVLGSVKVDVVNRSKSSDGKQSKAFNGKILKFKSEYRTLNVIFVKVLVETTLRMMQKVIEVFLDKLDEFQGVFQQFSVDDKGYTLLGCFGLPPYSNGTCSINCVKAAKAFVKAAEKIEGQDRNNFVVSIATGDILFTTLGVDDRKEAGLLGEVFNTAARLLGTQSEECRIIIEPRTYALVKQICKCRDLGRVKVKGKNKSLQIWGISEDMDSNTSVQMEKGIIGNTQEWQRVKAGFDEWILDRDKKHIVLIQGASGIGKTSLLMHLQSYMRNRYVMHCYARGADLDQTIPLGAFRTLFINLFHIFEKLEDVSNIAYDTASRFVGNLLDKVNEDRSYLNLVLEWLFPGSVNDDASVKEVWDSKMSILASLVGKILLNVVEEDRIAIILDDFQWIDSGSIEAIVNVASTSTRVCLYIFSRPLENGRAIENIALDQTVELTGASPADIKAYIIKSLNVRSVEDELCVSIHKKTGGNLLQLDTLISRMKEHHFDTKGRARKNLCMDAGFWSAQSFENILSEKVESIIIAQMDGLDPGFQDILKVASILGHYFSLVDVVFLLNDQNLTVTKVREIVLSEDTYGFIAKDPSLSADDLFESTSFRHITIRNAIYESISMASRQTMHLQMAERYEMIKGEAERKAAMPQTCYHYWRSGCVPKLIYWNVQFGISLMFDGLLYESTCTLKEICEFIEKSEIVNNGFDTKVLDAVLRGEAFGILAWSSLNILTIQETQQYGIMGLKAHSLAWPSTVKEATSLTLKLLIQFGVLWRKTRRGRRDVKNITYTSRDIRKHRSLQYAMAGLMGSFIFDPEIERHKMVYGLALMLVVSIERCQSWPSFWFFSLMIAGRVLMRSRALNGLGRKITLRSTECRKFLEENDCVHFNTHAHNLAMYLVDIRESVAACTVSLNVWTKRRIPMEILKSKGFLILPNFLLGQVHDTLGDTMPLIKEMAVKSPVWTMGLASYILIESFLLNRLDNATLAYSVFEELHTRVSGPQFFMVGSTPTLARLIMVLLSRTHAVEPVCSRPELVSEAVADLAEELGTSPVESSVGRAFFVAIYLFVGSCAHTKIASGGRSLRNIAPLLARASKWLFERLAISTMGRCGYWLTFAAEAMVVGDVKKKRKVVQWFKSLLKKKECQGRLSEGGDLMGLGGITCATIGLMLEEEEGRIWRRRAADIFRQMRADMLVIWVEGRI